MPLLPVSGHFRQEFLEFLERRPMKRVGHGRAVRSCEERVSLEIVPGLRGDPVELWFV